MVSIHNIGAGRGTGIIVETNKILTAGHVVSMESPTSLHQYKIYGKGTYNGDRYPAKGESSGNPDTRDDVTRVKNWNKPGATHRWASRPAVPVDLGGITIRTKDFDPLEFLEGPLKPYEKVWAVGIPAQYQTIFITEGNYQATLPKGFNKYIKVDTVLHSAHTIGGMSGGAVLVCRKGKFLYAGTISAIGKMRVPSPFALYIPIPFISFTVNALLAQNFVKNNDWYRPITDGV